MEQEEIYLISQKCPDGSWNKLCKSQEHYWWTEKEAKDWLAVQPDWMRLCCAVFKVTITVDKVEKVYDLKLTARDEWETLKEKVWKNEA